MNGPKYIFQSVTLQRILNHWLFSQIILLQPSLSLLSFPPHHSLLRISPPETKTSRHSTNSVTWISLFAPTWPISRLYCTWYRTASNEDCFIPEVWRELPSDDSKNIHLFSRGVNFNQLILHSECRLSSSRLPTKASHPDKR